MIIEQKHHEVNSNVEAKEHKFQINTGAGAVQLLIDFLAKLYKNPRRTLMTEYVQNALDSHYLAGKSSEPIDIQVPNKLDPHYRVRDYGVSMTHEEVTGMFVTAFDSSKRDSDDLRGGYGVGKLVFGPYAGVMYLTAWKEGKKRVYLCRLQDGDGGVTLLSEIDSDAPQGIEIKIPVKEDDFTYFQNQAKYVYAFLPTQPRISGSYGFNIRDNDNILYENDKITVMKQHIPNSSSAIATIGNLPFPIDYCEMGYDNVWERPFALHFDVGELSHTPSRDALEYNEKTVKALRDRLKEVVNDVLDQALTDIQSAPNIYEARLLLANYASDNNLVADLIRKQLDNGAIEYRGKRLSTMVSVDSNISFELAQFSRGRRSGNLNYRPASRIRYELTNAGIKVFFFPLEMSNASAIRRLRYEVTEQNDYREKLYVVRASGLVDTMQKAAEALSLPLDCLVDVSTLPEPPKSSVTRSSNGSYSTSKVFELKEPIRIPIRNYNWGETEIDLRNDSYIYVPICRYRPDGIVNDYTFRDFVETLRKYSDAPIIGIKRSHVKQAQRNKNAVNLFEYGKQMAEDFEEELRTEAQKLKNKQALSQFCADFSEVLEMDINCSATKTVLRHLARYNNIKVDKYSLQMKLNDYRLLAGRYVPLSQQVDVQRLEAYAKFLQTRYPLLSVSCSENVSDAMSFFEDFLNTIRRYPQKTLDYINMVCYHSSNKSQKA